MNRVTAIMSLLVGFLILHSGLSQPVPLLPTGVAEDLRWMDTAGNYYSETFRNTYAYDDATVTADTAMIEIEDGSSRPAVLMAGAGLKPNFTYQLKFEGKPTYLNPDGDDWGNEQIGYAGRWWLTTINTRTGAIIDQWNSDDAEYEYWKERGFKDKRRKTQYVFTGYLLFGYLVTDPSGNIIDDAGNLDLAVFVDTSLHVLWKESQRTPGANDSLSLEHAITVDDDAYGYGELTPADAGPVHVYGEWEPTRALPGDVVLPDGNYDLALIVTEETFHNHLGDGTDELGGFWQTVLVAESVQFTVGTPPPPPPPPPELGSLSGTITINGKPARKLPVELIQDSIAVRSTTTNPKGSYSFQDLPYGDYEIECDSLPAGSVTIDGAIDLDIGL